MRRSALASAGCLALALLLPLAALADVIPDRRRDYDERAANEYLLLPAVASLPGIGIFVGLIASGSNVADTGIDLAATVAESIDNSDIQVRAIAAREIPTGIPGLTFDYQYGKIKLGNLETYLPGRDSPNFTYPITARFEFQLLRPSLRLFQRRFTLSYGLAYFEGFDVDRFGNETKLARYSASGSLRLDFTDDVVDPRVGTRFEFRTTLDAPSSSIFGKEEGTSETFGGRDNITVRDYDLTFYVPFSKSLFLAWNNQYFQAVGDVEPGRIVTGGSPPLRGYPAGRWSDRYGVFSGLELRYLVPLGLNVDIVLIHGILEGYELAVFYEVGQVSPTDDSTLFDDMHQSYGAGVRMLFEAIIVRFDLANGDEGVQTHLTIGHAF